MFYVLMDQADKEQENKLYPYSRPISSEMDQFVEKVKSKHVSENQSKQAI